MKEFNPVTATPDAIVGFVYSLGQGKLRSELINASLEIRNIESQSIKINKSLRDAIKEADDLIEDNTTATLRIDNEINELKRKRVFSFNINLFGFRLNIHFAKA